MKLSRILIDAKLLLEDLGEEPYIWTDTDSEIQEHSDWLRFKEMIEHQPTVDAVEVVRCKNCKHWKHIAHVGCSDLAKVCMLANYMIVANGYCLYGERRTDDGRV